MPRRSRYIAITSIASFVVLSACTTLPPPPAIGPMPPTACVRSLSADLDSIIAAAPDLKGSQFALVVRDVQSGAILYERNADQRLVPASTLKLLISAAAFDRLGSQYQFITSVSGTGSVKNGVLHGNLYLRGTGDPTIQPIDYARLAAEIASRGIRSISGDVVFDDTWFDTTLVGPGWTQDDESFAFDAPISALTVSPDEQYNPATVDIRIMPGATLGAPLTVEMIPPNGYITVLNAGLTGTTNTLTVAREHGTERVVVRGTLPADAKPQVSSTSVGNPTRYVADIFSRALREQGVRVDGVIAIGEATPADAKLMAKHLSMPLSEITVRFLKRSINGHAESITKTLGRSFRNVGSWQAGIDAITAFLRDNDIDGASFRQTDGSGLSRYNSVSTKTLDDLLVAAYRKPWFDTWYAALPVAGNPDPLIGGTLSNRMRGTVAENNVHAKTGSMSGVSGLSGYVADADKRPLAFSMLTNNALVSVKPIEDEIVLKLASWHQPKSSCTSD